MFVDASAIIAVLSSEPEADDLAAALDRARLPITSPIAVYEATLGICRTRGVSVAAAQQTVVEFLRVTGVRTISVTEADGLQALDAFSRYGRGQGHPAQLNLGDCFAYAMAKSHGTSLLFKGDDFSRTDIDPASSPI